MLIVVLPDFALLCLQRIPRALARKVINQVMPMLNRDYISVCGLGVCACGA